MGVVVPVCVCALFMGHIGYISLKTKNVFFFIIKVFSQKLETTKKKKKKKKVCFSCALQGLCSVSASCRLLTPSGLVLWATCGEAVSRWFISDLQSEGRASQYITGHFCTSGFGVGVQAGTQCIGRNRDTPQVWYQVLKLFGICPLPESL